MRPTTRCSSRPADGATPAARVAAGRPRPAPSRARCRAASFKVEVAEGETVEAGQVIAIIEAMKMENEITAPRAGVVAELQVAAGQTVTVGQVICRISDA